MGTVPDLGVESETHILAASGNTMEHWNVHVGCNHGKIRMNANEFSTEL